MNSKGSDNFLIEKESVLLLITTELGLLLALLYYLENLKNSRLPYFIILKMGEERFKGLNLNLLPGKFKVIKDQLNNNLLFPNKDFKYLLDLDNVAEIVYQNPYNLVTNILLKVYSKKNIKLKKTIVADGVMVLQGRGLRSSFKIYLQMFFRKFINGIYELPIIILNHKKLFASADCLISTHSLGNKYFINPENLFLKINENNLLIMNVFLGNRKIYKGSKIIFFTQPLYREGVLARKVKDNYWKALDNLFSFLQQQKIRVVIKIHPSEKVNQYDKYESKSIIIDRQKNTPAEVILNAIGETNIVSFYSSVSLSNINKRNNHYWLYKTIGHDLKLKMDIKHIIEPETIESFKEQLLISIK